MANTENIQIADLHCHILPGMDDGASDEEEALEMIRMEYNGGIREIALTSHFNCEKMELERFLERRMQSLERLTPALKKSSLSHRGIILKPAAEVMYSPNLYNLELKPLCIEGTGFMLLELPMHNPPYLDRVLYRLQADGITPIIAHIERYPYIMGNRFFLYRLAEREILIQMNAGAFLKGWMKTVGYYNLLRCGLVQLIASDTHSVRTRPPILSEALKKIKRRAGHETFCELCRASHLVFNGKMPEMRLSYCSGQRIVRRNQ